MQRTVRKTTFVFIVATGVFVLLLAQWQTHSQTPVSTCKEKNLAKPLGGLTTAQETDFSLDVTSSWKWRPSKMAWGRCSTGRAAANAMPCRAWAGRSPTWVWRGRHASAD